MSAQVGRKGCAVKLSGDGARAGTVQKMTPAFRILPVCKQVVGEAGMGVDMIRIDFRCAALMPGSAFMISTVVDGITDIA